MRKRIRTMSDLIPLPSIEKDDVIQFLSRTLYNAARDIAYNRGLDNDKAIREALEQSIKMLVQNVRNQIIRDDGRKKATEDLKDKWLPSKEWHPDDNCEGSD